jgi:hypothetical protein
LIGVSVIVPLPDAVTPVNVPITVEVQLNVVEPILEVGEKLSGVLLHICCINEVGVFVN